MKKKPPGLPGLPTMAALMLAAVITVWLGLFGPLLDLSKLKEWQTLISASVAAVGIAAASYIAVRNVSRQIRINILLREEDRVEKQLPGLRDARNFLSNFNIELLGVHKWRGDQSLRDAFLACGFDGSDKSIDKALPQTDQATKHRVLNGLNTAWDYARIWEVTSLRIAANEKTLTTRDRWIQGDYEKTTGEIERDRIRLEQYGQVIDDALKAIETDEQSLSDKIRSFENRLVLIRSELEEYFAAD